MDIEKPEPVHGWRQFVAEVGIIVLGVLIALGAEQAVQTMEWKEKVRLAEEAMRVELGSDDAPEIYQRAILHPCLLRQLDLIRTAVVNGSSRSEVVRAADGYRLQYLSFDSVAHDNATASDVTVHMPSERLALYTDAYAMMPTLDRTNAYEARDIAPLHAIRPKGGPLTDEERDRILGAIETLRGDEALIWGATRWSLPAIRKLGIAFDQKRMTSFTKWARDNYGDCIRELPRAFWG